MSNYYIFSTGGLKVCFVEAGKQDQTLCDKTLSQSMRMLGQTCTPKELEMTHFTKCPKCLRKV